MFKRFFSVILLLGLTASAVVAQSVRWQPPGGFLELGQATDLVLIFENCEPEGDLELPVVANLDWGTPQRGQQSSTTVVNGRLTSQNIVYFSFAVVVDNDAPIEIPAFEIRTTEGNFAVPAARFEVREATVGDTAIPVSDVSGSTIELEADSWWAGEVVPVEYQLEVSARFRAGLGGEPVWEPAPLVVEEFGELQQSREGEGGDARNVITYSTRGYISAPGSYVIPSVQQIVSIGVPSSSFISSIRAEQYAITSDSPQVTVKPLPQPVPATFGGAVGQFELVSTVVPENAAVGEPVTWTLELKGTGNWPEIPGLPARQVSNTFRVVQPDADREIPEGKLFDGSISEDVVLIPTQAGEFPLGPVEWTYFDPAVGEYRTISTERITLDITPSTTVPSPTVPNPAIDPTQPPPSALVPPTITASPAPDAPAMLPLEPLGDSATSAQPWSMERLITIAVGIGLIFPVLWIVLSAQRAFRADTGRAARLARKQLNRLLPQIEPAQSEARNERLRAWQQNAAILWHGTPGTPLAELFKGNSDWTDLWLDAERALYSERGLLPDDWTSRAQQVLRSKTAPRFPLFSVFTPRHLFPALIGAIVIGLGTSDVSAQGASDYQSGDFAEAEAAWREEIDADHGNWVAHHNLALALAQQGRFDEAGAHATVAFVQNPRHPSTRWHLTYTLERSGYAPPVIARFVNPRWPEQIARIASPAKWQRLILAGFSLAVLSLILVLLAAYGRRIPAQAFISWTGAILGVAVMAAGIFSLQVWGITADSRTVMTWQAGELRSIPTDLESEQEKTPLAAGSLATVEKPFLGWRQISFPNGQTGWLRKEAFVPLWADQN